MAQQQACVYAALILAESGKISADSLIAVSKAAGVEVTKGMATAFAGLLKDGQVDKILKNVSFGGGGAAAPAAAAAAPAAGKAAPAAAKAKEPEPEEDDDMGMGLFD
jgi:large subunit ribosomal protein LP1